MPPRSKPNAPGWKPGDPEILDTPTLETAEEEADTTIDAAPVEPLYHALLRPTEGQQEVVGGMFPVRLPRYKKPRPAKKIYVRPERKGPPAYRCDYCGNRQLDPPDRCKGCGKADRLKVMNI